MAPVGFEPTISTGEWPQTHALDRPDAGIGKETLHFINLLVMGK